MRPLFRIGILFAAFAVSSAGCRPGIAGRSESEALVTAPEANGLNPIECCQSFPGISDTTELSRRARPIAKLPQHVVAVDQQLTLFADFANPTAKGVPIYIVNRTSQTISLHEQDDDLYLKLEYESAPGTWTRALSHSYSDCGNSYGVENLGAGRFILESGYRPTQGNKAKVRYRFYGHNGAIASNAGEGLVDPAEVERAATDTMTIRCGSFDFLRRVALGRIEKMASHRFTAIWQLCNGEFDRREVENVLEAVAKDENEKLAGEASDLLRRLKEKGQR